jgi:hypothetical protein
MPIIPTLMELRQENLELEAILGYILRSPSPEKNKKRELWHCGLLAT